MAFQQLQGVRSPDCSLVSVPGQEEVVAVPQRVQARFYNVSEILTPTLAWAFFGPDEELSSMVNEFRDQVLGFLKDIFSFHSADYKTVESLSKSVMTLTKARLDNIKRKLGCQTDS